jgi:hypothetical protein
MYPLGLKIHSLSSEQKPLCEDRYDVIISGESQIQYAIAPDLLSKKLNLKVINLAKPSQYGAFHFYLLKEIIAQNKQPRLVILSAPFYLFKRSTSPDALLALPKHQKFFDHYIMKVFQSQFNNWNQIGQLQLKQAGEIIKRKLRSTRRVFKETCRADSYYFSLYPKQKDHSLLNQSENTRQNHKKLVYKDDYSLKMDSHDFNVMYWKKTFALLEENQIPTLLIEAPQYIHSYTMLSDRDLYYQEIKSLIEDYQYLIFLPQKTWAIDPKSKELFFDGGKDMESSHLSYRGSQLFTQELASFINKNTSILIPWKK